MKRAFLVSTAIASLLVPSLPGVVLAEEEAAASEGPAKPETIRISQSEVQFSDFTEVERAPTSRLPFAARLADLPSITGPDGWRMISRKDAWQAIARSSSADRQAARWNLAVSLIGKDRPQDALGVLDVMREDDPALELVASFRLARGAVLAAMGRGREALHVLDLPSLAENPEACVWRMKAYADVGEAESAMGEFACARDALNERSPRRRRPFVYIAADAAIEVGKTDFAHQLLAVLPDGDSKANLLRGKAFLLDGDGQRGDLALQRVARGGTGEQRIDAKLGLIESGLAQGSLTAVDALGEIDKLTYSWRGGPIEQRALRLQYGLARQVGDDKATLASGATLFRYFPLGNQGGALLEQLRQDLGRIVSVDSDVPLVDAAGLFWDYRDLSPTDAEGDFMVSQLAQRLETARLYHKAAELLNYQLRARLRDISQGPLSVRVAKLFILAGDPEAALSAIRGTEYNSYPDDMLWDRYRIQAVALYQLDRPKEALSLLEEVPDSGALKAEIRWSSNDWSGLVADESLLPASRVSLNAMERASVLRYAVALAMLDREIALENLRLRYGAAFVGTSGEAAFELLTGPVSKLDADTIARAMEDVPSQSPAGPIGDLLYVRKS